MRNVLEFALPSQTENALGPKLRDSGVASHLEAFFRNRVGIAQDRAPDQREISLDQFHLQKMRP